MVINKYGDRLYKWTRVDTETRHLRAVAARVESNRGDSFLRALRDEWNSHNKSMTIVSQIFMYMDRHYVGQNELRHVHQLGLDLWRDVVVRDERIRDRLLTLLLDAVARERAGEMAERSLLATMTKDAA
jgi:hypothetical protein